MFGRNVKEHDHGAPGWKTIEVLTKQLAVLDERLVALEPRKVYAWKTPEYSENLRGAFLPPVYPSYGYRYRQLAEQRQSDKERALLQREVDNLRSESCSINGRLNERRQERDEARAALRLAEDKNTELKRDYAACQSVNGALRDELRRAQSDPSAVLIEYERRCSNQAATIRTFQERLRSAGLSTN